MTEKKGDRKVSVPVSGKRDKKKSTRGSTSSPGAKKKAVTKSGSRNNPAIEPVEMTEDTDTVADSMGKYTVTPEETVPVDEQPYPLPEGWKWVRLGKITDSIQYGYTAASSVSEIGPKLLRITDIQDDDVDWESVPYCEMTESDFKKYKLNKDDIVVARTGATTGKSFLLPAVNSSVFASYLIRIRLCEEIVSSRFTWSYMRSPCYWTQIQDNLNGIAQPGVNASKLSQLFFPLPPLSEQTRIVARLESLLGKIKEARALIDEAKDSFETRRAAILSKAFRGELTREWRESQSVARTADDLIDAIIEEKAAQAETNKKTKVPTREEIVVPAEEEPYQLPDGWRWVRFNSIILRTQLGLVRGSSDQSDFFDYNYLKMNNITNSGSISPEFVKVKASTDEIRDFELHPNDLLFNTRNSKELVGKNAVFDLAVDEPVLFNNNIMRIVLRVQTGAHFVSYFLNSGFGKFLLDRIKSATTNISAIYAKDLLVLPLPLPPLDEQREIVSILDRLLDREKEAAAACALEEELELLEKSVLARAFRGEI